ncbi:Adenosylmethionine-8-amino-7-oxononanoate aminotransferase [Candidatus Magnetomoraceae bacterium gMMP-15]
MIENKERNKQLEEDSKKYIWYPFTQMRDFINEEPVIIEKAEGCILKDIYGNEYIDGISSLWTNVHGHKKEKIDNAIIKQIENIAHSTLLGLSNVPAVNLAKKLINIAPKGLTRVFYSDSGSSAVEIALKMAFQYQQQKGNPKKKKFISMKNAYHGDTIGSVSLGGIDLFHEVYGPLLFDSFKAESPYCYRCPFEKFQSSCDLKCLKQMESIMEEHADEVTALIIEPLVQGAAGILVHPDNYLKELRKLCTKYNILMIADEVAVGFGKTGSMFACEKEGVEPDIMALAKGISGGYLPLAATLTSEEIFQGFLGKYEDFKTFFHGHTYTGNPVACAAALANLEIFEQEQVIDKLQVKINHFSKRLEKFKSLLHVGDVRRQGIMVGIELVLNKESKSVYLPEDKIGQKVIAEARKHGLIIRPLGNVIVLMPPLSISIEELDRLCDITYEAIKFITE